MQTKLKNDIAKNWKYDSEKKAYISNYQFLNNLDSLYGVCLHGKDTLFIIKHFGNKYKITLDKKRNEYNMDFHVVVTTPGVGAGRFFFVLDDKYKVKVSYCVFIDSNFGTHSDSTPLIDK